MLSKLKNLFASETKRFSASPIVALQTVGRAQWSPRNYGAQAKEGFSCNAVGYRCARMIAEAAASVPLMVYADGVEQSHHPVIDLLKRPNPVQTGREVIDAAISYLLLAGNAYIEVSLLDGVPRELVCLRPDRTRIIPGARGWPEAFEYAVNGNSVTVPAEAVLHIKLFNPLDDYYGLSPLEAAARALDTHNAAAQWNKAMLDNAARPSGALVFAASEGQLSAEQFDRLKRELEDSYQGAGNAGRPLVLEGGLDWKEMGFSPKDMDFIEAKNSAAREVALAFGVPPMLLGIPGDNTYANFAEANRAFWRQTVLPQLGRVTDALAHFLSPSFGAIDIKGDLDQVEALSFDRDALWKRVGGADFLSHDEKRQAVGYSSQA